MGTNLQTQNLSPDDFGGEHLNGCNEILVVSRPAAVEKVHADFLAAGCDVIETDTFGGTPVVLAEYGLGERAYELNRQAAAIARSVATDYSANGRPRFVAGSMGPTTKLPSLGHMAFREMERGFYIQAQGLADGGAERVHVEPVEAAASRDVREGAVVVVAVQRMPGGRRAWRPGLAVHVVGLRQRRDAHRVGGVREHDRAALALAKVVTTRLCLMRLQTKLASIAFRCSPVRPNLAVRLRWRINF